MATVTATYTDSKGDPASGQVYISPVKRLPTQTTIITEKKAWADLDANGSVFIEVMASDDPRWQTDTQVPYLVEERLMGLPFRSYYAYVPSTGVDLADVQPLDDIEWPQPVAGDLLSQPRWTLDENGGIPAEGYVTTEEAPVWLRFHDIDANGVNRRTYVLTLSENQRVMFVESEQQFLLTGTPTAYTDYVEWSVTVV